MVARVLEKRLTATMRASGPNTHRLSTKRSHRCCPLLGPCQRRKPYDHRGDPDQDRPPVVAQHVADEDQDLGVDGQARPVSSYMAVTLGTTVVMSSIMMPPPSMVIMMRVEQRRDDLVAQAGSARP